MVSATDIYTYHRLSECARRVWLEANRPDLRAPLSEFEQILMRRGQEHEEKHLATFPQHARPEYPVGDLAAGAEATAKLVSARKPIIYHGVLLSPEDDLIAIPDFLIREGQSYVIREAKLALCLRSRAGMITSLTILPSG